MYARWGMMQYQTIQQCDSHIVGTPLSMYIHVRDDVTPASTEIIQHQSQRRFKIKKKLTDYNNVASPHAQTQSCKHDSGIFETS